MASRYTTRDYAPYDLIHFTVRGHNRRRIFLSQADHDEFLGALRVRLDRIPAAERPTLHAVGQMPNHQHLFMRSGPDPELPPKLMRAISTSYAKSFNERNGLRGKVFQRPFRGKVIRGTDHIMNTFAYIHLNPDASLRIDNSSHGVYLGIRDDPHIDTSLAWTVFGGQQGYIEFFNDTARLRAARAAARSRLES